MSEYLSKIFKLEGKIAAVIGAGGYLCSEVASAFGRAGVSVAVRELRNIKGNIGISDLACQRRDNFL